MKTDYKFGDKVKVLPKRENSIDYRNDVSGGDVGVVISNDGSNTFPVEVQFVLFTEVFNYEELEFFNWSI